MSSRACKNQKLTPAGFSSDWEQALLVNFTEDRREQCVQLLSDAMIMECGMDIWDQARIQCEAKVKEFHTRGMWPMVLKEIQDFKSKGAGAMSDASKRQRSSSPKGPPAPVSAIPAVIPEHGLGDFTPPRQYPGEPARIPASPAAESTTSETSSAPTTPAMQVPLRPLPFPLPSGVSSMEEWGRTVVGFGKFGGKNITYWRLATMDTDEAGSYRMWAMNRVKGSNEALTDLARYFSNASAMGFLGTRISGLRAAQRKEFQREIARD